MAEGAWEEHEQLRGGRWVEHVQSLYNVRSLSLRVPPGKWSFFICNLERQRIDILPRWELQLKGRSKRKQIRSREGKKRERKKKKTGERKFVLMPCGLRVGILTSLTGSVNFFVSQLTFLPVIRKISGITRMKALLLSHTGGWSLWWILEVTLSH